MDNQGTPSVTGKTVRDRNIYCQLKFKVENLEMSLMIPSGPEC